MSSGLLLYKISGGTVHVLLGHMGGPFWSAKDSGAWSIPKGEYDEREDTKAAAYREFEEELGRPAPLGMPVCLGDIRQASGKVLTVFALQADFDERDVRSNTFEMEYPKGSGLMRSFPEIDKAEWMTVDAARTRISRGQTGFLDRLRAHLEEAGELTEN